MVELHGHRMKISWIADDFNRRSDGSYVSALASTRYRAIAPANRLVELGLDVQLVRVQEAINAIDDSPDVLMISKIALRPQQELFKRDSQHVLKAASEARRKGMPVIGDFNDNHFDDAVLGPYWRGLADVSSVCVVGSEAMGEAVRRVTTAPIHVIGDPLSSPYDTPRVFRRPREGAAQRWIGRLLPGRVRDRLMLAWYGHPLNFPALQGWAEQLVSIAPEQPLTLWAVTRLSEPLVAWVEDYNRRNQPRAKIELVAWDEETQWAVVRDSDVVLVPSDPSDHKKIVKTSNRVSDALNLGRYVVASPIPAYLPFASSIALTDDPVLALRKYIDEPKKAMDAIVRGQAMARKLFDGDVIARAWLRAIESACAKGGKPDALNVVAASGLNEPERELVRLNLGCGDKILPGYVNVDVVESRAGKKPDVICDLHVLAPFADGSADEVMAIHVVEHFWRWEIEAILREWVRVLRPGGRMVLECPNLISACEEFLMDPDRRSLASQEGQRTMWVFYGDPAWEDPYMIHRWGYTPKSLGDLMRSVGLVNVRQEPAQFKLREPRDMRLVGEKRLP